MNDPEDENPMHRNRFLPLAAPVLLAAGLAAWGAEQAPDDDAVVAWADRRTTDWQPRRGERCFDEIGWARDIRAARKLAKEHQRPVFLFTMDGHINIGRC
jgi:hypothetical protein